MISDEEHGIFEEIDKKSFAQALSESNDNCADLSNYSLKTDVNNLGNKISDEYLKLYEKLNDAEDVVRDAIKLFRIAQRRNYLWWTMCFAAGVEVENELTSEYANTFEAGYATS